MFLVPIFQNVSSKFIMQVELDGESFRLRFYWNSREEKWYMDILNIDDEAILTNVAMVIEYLLLTQYKHIADLPKGNFILLDLESNPSTGGVTFDNLGRRYQLVFFSNKEIEAGEVSGGI